MLNRAAAAIEDAAANGERRPATVRYSVAELDSGATPEDLLGADGDELDARAHRPLKTVMLAD